MLDHSARFGRLSRALGVKFALGAVSALAIAGAIVGSFGGCGSAGLTGINEPDAGDAGETGVTGPRVFNVIAVNASPDLPAVRFCIKVGGTFVTYLPIPDDPTRPMPESNYPGVPVGSGFPLPRIPLGEGAVTLYALHAAAPGVVDDVQGSLGAQHACADLICLGASCLAQSQFVELPITLAQDGTTSLLVIEGSEAAGSLTTQTFPLDQQLRAVSMGVQLAQLAPGLAAGARVSFGQFGASTSKVLVNGTGYLTVGPGAAVAVDVPSSDTEFAQVGLIVDTFQDGGPTQLTFALADIPRLSDPTALPRDYFKPQRNYIFALIGDPARPSSDPHGLHAVAFPSAMLRDSGP